MMMKLFGACALALFLCQPAPAEQSPGPVAVVRQMREAVAGVDSVAYNARFFGIGARDGRVIEADGRIILQRADHDGPVRANLRVESAVRKPGLGTIDHEMMRYDGAAVWRHSLDEGWVDRGDIGEGGERHTGFGSFLWSWPGFADATPFADLDGAWRFDRESDAEVGGIACFVVRIRPAGAGAIESAPGPHRRLYVGKEDALPRRIETIEIEDGAERGASVLLITGLRTGVAVAPEFFKPADAGQDPGEASS